MAKFLVFSDLHAYRWPAFAHLSKRGVNSRLLSIISVLKNILQASKDNNCDAILFAGDLFHTPKIDVTEYDLVARQLRASPIPIVMIPGNHDEAEAGPHYHSMRALVGKGRILLDPREGCITKQGDTVIGGIPFCKDVLSEMKAIRGADIILMHTGFAGAQAGFDYIAEQKKFLQASKLYKYDYRLIIAGHFHTPQLIYKREEYPTPCNDGVEYPIRNKLILIPGAPLPHTFGDVGPRGYWIIDDKRAKFTKMGAPQFVKLDPSRESHMTVDLLRSLIAGNYVHYTAHSMEEYKMAHEILSVDAVGFSITLEEKRKKEANRINICLDTPRLKALKRYVKANPMHKIDNDRLIDIGLNLLSMAESNA